MGYLMRAPAGVGDAGLKGQRHRMIGDQISHQLFGRLSQIPKLVGVGAVKHLFKVNLIQPLARANLSPIAP